MSIKAVIFDCFGVIVTDSFSVTYLALGGDPDADSEFIADILLSYNNGMITSTELYNAVAEKLKITPKQWRSARDKAEHIDTRVLGYIKELKKNYKTGLLTNAGKGSLERRFSNDELDIYFDDVVASGNVGMVKPYTEIYELAATRLGVEPEECIFIDDRELYCEGAELTGMKTILYQDYNQLKTELGQLLADAND